MKQRHENNGLRKICGCSRRTWATCPHSWHFNYARKGGPKGGWRFSIDSQVGHHVQSKTEAANYADGWRIEMRNGTFVRRDPTPVQTPASAAPAATPDTTTFRQLGELWFERRKPKKGRKEKALSTVLTERGHVNQIARFTPTGQPALGDLAVKSITPDMLELFFTGLRLAGKAAGTRNKYRQTALSLFKWATKHRYLDRLPINADDDESEIAHVSERDAKRHRRLKPGEEDALLKHANPFLQRLIVGALETAMRSGELLHLRWADVDLVRRIIHVRPETNKTRKYRAVPISARLLAFLKMARTDRTGEDRPLTDYVFSDDTGRKVGWIKKAWHTCVLKAHGQTLTWSPTGGLSAETRAALAAIDLHFHDLRHEAGSRRIEEGWELHKVRDVLGHASLEQTSTYLNTSTEGLLESQRRSDEKRRGEPHSVASALQDQASQSIAIVATGHTPSTDKSLVN